MSASARETQLTPLESQEREEVVGRERREEVEERERGRRMMRKTVVCT